MPGSTTNPPCDVRTESGIRTTTHSLYTHTSILHFSLFIILLSPVKSPKKGRVPPCMHRQGVCTDWVVGTTPPLSRC